MTEVEEGYGSQKEKVKKKDNGKEKEGKDDRTRKREQDASWLVVFYGISTLVVYLMPKYYLFNTNISYMIC